MELVLYTLHAAFFFENPDDIHDGMLAIDDVKDVLFIIDVIINFRSTFLDKKGNEIFDPVDIRQHYLRTWFAIDALAAFPV